MAAPMAKKVNLSDDGAKRALAVFQLLLKTIIRATSRFLFGTVVSGRRRPAPLVPPTIKHPQALRRTFRNTANDLSISEAYIRGDLEVEGDLEAALPLAYYLVGRRLPTSNLLRAGWELFRLPASGRSRSNGRQPARLHGELHSVERDRQAVTYHYNVSNDFYALWLDRRMVYSCAYFETADDDLDTAQVRKLDYLCRKLRLRPGERLLDVGCGWGGLIIHAAQHYGVDALGITLSENQAKLANERIVQAGLQSRCRADVRDYRALKEPGSFDKVVSVGMFEHVGESQLPLYFQHAWQLLRAGGVFLNHGIARRATDPEPTGPGFISRYVFPDGDLVSVNAALRYAEEAGFEVRDLESLREHYTLTLRHWARRLELHREQALQAVDQATYRVWRLFLPGSAHAFAAGSLNVYQALLLKPDQGRSDLPLTRADWYR